MKFRAFYGLSLAVSFLSGGFAQSEPKPTFEVVSAKISPKGTKGLGLFIESGRLRDVNASMGGMLQTAFGIASYQIVGLRSGSEGDAVNDPSSANRYMIEATFPKGTTRAKIYLMYQTLLADRFKLAYHWEKRETKAYVLTVDAEGLKMTKSAGPQAIYVGGGPGLLQGDPMPMEALTGQLTQILGAPVVDRTHLEGDFRVRVKYLPDDAPPEADGVSIFTALRDQLGLRLETGRPLIDYLVIDHLNRVPTEN